MAIYVVMEPPRSRPNAEPVYVRDGFSWLGFLLPIVWLLWNRLWIETVVFLVITLGLGLLGERAGLAEFAVAALSILLSIYIGMEGTALRLWALRRRGWTEWGVVDGENRQDAEVRHVSETAGTPPSHSRARSDAVRRYANARDAGRRAGTRALRISGKELRVRVAIIDYGSGNLRSATKAFERAAREAKISAEIDLTDDAEKVRTADRIVLPGVGAYADCVAGLRAVEGMWEAIEETALRRGRPFLGICVGMQLMSERGLEKTVSRGFGWIAGDVKEIEPRDPSLKIPQIGWNTIHVKHPHPLFEGIHTGENGLHAYFVHSYHLAAKNPDDVLAVTDYGGEVTAAVARDNLAGTQFHPEKSQTLGLALIANFLRWNP